MRGVETEHLELDSIRLRRFHRTPGFVDGRYFLVRPVEGKFYIGIGAGTNPLDQLPAEHVNGNAPGAVEEIALVITGRGQISGKVAVLQDFGFSVALDKNAHLFFGIGFHTGLVTQLRAGQNVKTDKFGVDAAHQGIVDLEESDTINAARLHVGDATIANQGTERSP